MADVLAYYITWRTYGTWLPGDSRGWVRHGEGSSQVPFRELDHAVEGFSEKVMKEKPVYLTKADRRLIDDGIRETCCIRSWFIHALNVRTNHIHVVLVAPNHSPERVMTDLKAWGSRRLNAAKGRRENWWERHGSTRWIKDEDSLALAIGYALDQ